MEIDFSLAFWIAVIVMLPLMPYLLKRFRNVEVWGKVIMLIRTKRFLPWFDKLSRSGRVLDLFADLGIIFGFGAIAVDYLWGRKMVLWKRVLLFVISVSAVGGFFLLFDMMMGIVMGGSISSGLYTKEIFWLFVVLFGVFGFAGFALLALAVQAADILIKTSEGVGSCPGVAPLIPGVEIPGVPIAIPLYGWLVLLIILVVHEGMHGVIARREGFSVKNAGLLLLSFLPIGAFVEPDEKEIKNGPKRSALRVFAAGPTANLLSIGVILIVLFASAAVISIFIEPNFISVHEEVFGGVVITEVDENVEFCGVVYDSPAYGVLEEGQVIESVNGIEITSASKLSYAFYQSREEELEMVLSNEDGSRVEETIEPNELGAYGIAKVEELQKEGVSVPWEYTAYRDFRTLFFDFLSWLFILSMLVAIVNFLPLGIFDGGRMANIIFVPYFSVLGKSKEETEKIVGKIFLWGVLILLAINALPLII